MGKYWIFKIVPNLLNSVNNKCPAIIFAVKRTVKVIGRINILIVSINTINGINKMGVPWGTKCWNMWNVFFNQPNNIKVIHTGNATVRLKIKCLVLVKIYGNKPIKLLITIVKKTIINIKVNRFLLVDLKIILYSLCRIINLLLKIILNLLGANQ